MANHIIKYDHDDGKKLPRHKRITWCGRKPNNWSFQDAQHALLSLDQGQLAQPCRSCLMKMKLVINAELNEG